jgi:hypothetical protein
VTGSDSATFAAGLRQCRERGVGAGGRGGGICRELARAGVVRARRIVHLDRAFNGAGGDCQLLRTRRPASAVSVPKEHACAHARGAGRQGKARCAQSHSSSD